MRVSQRADGTPDVEPAVLVLGIGNLLWADEGFGVRAAEALHARWRLPSRVSVVDGGTQGLALLDLVCAADQLLVFDCVDFGLPPGTLQILRDRAVPAWSDRAFSLHQASFQELLWLARWRERFPRRLTLIGVQPAVIDDLGGSLSPLVRARVDEAVDLAVRELAAWGVVAFPRATPPTQALAADALALARYEAGRPSSDAACRIGDVRFLARRNG
ncbi:MAG TPA: HyaD/HybD family hydrogenase maturation endopeptidase [Burkholderiaceae bacterium]|nr:HyaD/HybD family hydrogenase maturation endopeptidase [Burkholderiaceae bacterium]